MRRWLPGVMATALLAGEALATPYQDPVEAERLAGERARMMPAGAQHVVQTREMDNVADSVLTVEYLQLLNWLTGMQEPNPGPNYGGLHEGESPGNWAIIQTDNTQEALRDWSHYARITGDLERYALNVERAWAYTLNWPAYLEEGGNPGYYRVHNCGWGLVAAMEYTEAYGENATCLAYADSCARYLDRWRLSWSGFGIELNPLAAGFGAGALHEYALWRGNPDWEEAAEEIAGNVKTWIEASPNRLNNNETWAMSGGTAMWGVITALFLDDPGAGEAWLPNYLTYMDTYSGGGQWNNSWTVWYGFAWQRAHQVLETQETLDDAIEVADYILAQGDLDTDAGVPGTQGLWNDDQSWTSAYQVWYEIEALLHLNPPGEDPVALDIVGMPESWPLIVGVPMPVAAKAANGGLLPSPPEELNTSITFTYPGGSATFDGVMIPFGVEVAASMGEWVPEQAGQATISFTISSANDTNPDNNTLERTYTVSNAYYISGVLADSLTGAPLSGMVRWTQQNIMPVRTGEVVVDGGSGEYEIPVASGTYVLEALPDVTPYLSRAVSCTVTNSDLAGTDFMIPPARVLYLSTNLEADHDTLLIDAFAANGFETYLWRQADRGMPGTEILADPLDLVIWSVREDADVSFDQTQWDAISTYRNDNDHRYGMLFSGDGIMETLSDEQKAELGVGGDGFDHPTPLLVGVPGSPFLTDDTLFVGGLLPQEAADEVVSIEGNATAVGEYYPYQELGGQAIDSWTEVGTIVLGYGLEGINEFDGRFVSREEFVHRLIVWFGQSTAVAEGSGFEAERPVQWSLSAWPNPFNAYLRIRVTSLRESELVLFDILGREVRRWAVRGSSVLNLDGGELASGMYFLRLEADGAGPVQKVLLLR